MLVIVSNRKIRTHGLIIPSWPRLWGETLALSTFRHFWYTLESLDHSPFLNNNNRKFYSIRDKIPGSSIVSSCSHRPRTLCPSSPSYPQGCCSKQRVVSGENQSGLAQGSLETWNGESRNGRALAGGNEEELPPIPSEKLEIRCASLLKSSTWGHHLPSLPA